MSNTYDHDIKMNMLDTYYFKDKKEAKEMLFHKEHELTEWYYNELQKYKKAYTFFDQWFEEYTGQSFDEMLKEENENI